MDSETLGIIVASLGPTIGAAMIFAVRWLKNTLELIEQNKEVKAITSKLTQSNGQGDTLIDLGKKLSGEVVNWAKNVPAYKPFVEKLQTIYDDGIAVWNDEEGSDEQMADAEKAFNDVYTLLNNAHASQTPK